MANLFTSQTPTLADINEAQTVTVSTTVYFLAAGTVTGGRFYAPATVGAGTYALALWQITADDSPAQSGTGTLLGSGTAGTVTGGTWVSVAFGSSVSVSTGIAYRIGLRSSAGRYTATGAGFNSAGLTNGNIVAPQTGTNPAAVNIGALDNGSFIEDITSYPNKTFNGNMYFVDVEYTAGADVTPPSVPASLTNTAVTATTASFSWSASTDDTAVTGYELQIIGP